MIATLISISLSLSSVQEAKAPAVDRSGEPLLLAMAKASQSSRLGALIVIESRESGEDPFTVAKQLQFAKDGNDKFRVRLDDMWGSCSAYIRNGGVILSDPYDMESGVTLSDAGSKPWENLAAIAPKGDAFSAFVLFSLGSEGVEKLVPKTVALLEVDPPGPLKGVEFESKDLGKVRILCSEKDRSKRCVQIDYDNMPTRKHFAELYPEWVGPPVAGCLDVETIHYVPISSLGKDLFSVKVSKGMRVTDNRKKK